MRKIAFVVLASAAYACSLAQTTIPVGVDVGVFFPTDSMTRSVFGDSWFRIGITPLSFQRPDKWKGTFDIGYLHRSQGGDSVTLLPITFGVTRSFGGSKETRPYVAIRVGPYWGDVNSPTFGVDRSKVGFDANASVGITFSDTFYIEGRYDFFSDFDGIKFSGAHLSAGIRIFEIKL